MTLLAGHVVVTVALASPLCAGIFYHISMPCKKIYTYKFHQILYL